MFKIIFFFILFLIPYGLNGEAFLEQMLISTNVEATFNEPMNTDDSLEIILSTDSPRELAVEGVKGPCWQQD